MSSDEPAGGRPADGDHPKTEADGGAVATDGRSVGLDVQRLWWERAADSLGRASLVPEQAGRMADVDVGTTPSEVVYRENKLELLHYEPLTDEQHATPILVVYALINRPYVLDLQPNRSVVRTLLEAGFDVYLIDWGEPSRLDASLTLDDYVNRYVHNCVDVVRERAGVDQVTLLGYCMGGTMSAMYTALHPERVRNLALLAAGMHFDDTGGVLELWGDGDFYDPTAVTDAFGNVPSEFLDVGFALMDPVENFLTKYVRLYDGLEDDDLVENFARMETWLSDGIDVAGATYEQFIEDLYQDNKLMRNELHLDGQHVDLADIEVPLLQIVGTYDHLIPPESSTPFNDVVASEDTEVMEFPSGHIGLSVSGRSHDQLWPAVAEWLAERSGPVPVGEQVVGEAGEGAPGEASEEVSEAATAESGAGVEAEAEAESTEPLEAVDGVGPAYADRLREAGVADLRALADADPEALAAEIDVSDKRVEEWVAQAGELVGE